MSRTVRHYALPISLYSGKTRAYLRYKGIVFEEIPATLWRYKRFIIPRTGVAFIPVVEDTDGTVVQDTTVIIDHFEARQPEPSVYPATPVQKLVALLLELYGDEWLLIPAMHYRWKYIDEPAQKRLVYGDFGSVIHPRLPAALRRFLGERLGQRFRGFLPILGVTPATEAAIEASYEALLRDLDAHFAEHDYLLGGRPSIGDYGLIAPLYAHLGRDPVPRALMEARAPHVAAWVDRMHAGTAATGDWLPDDAIPDTLLPVLKRALAEQWPVLADTARKLAEWHRSHPGEKLPRTIGKHAFRIQEAEGERGVFPYALWMAQRPVDHFNGLRGAERTAAEALLQAAGGSLELLPAPRLTRRNNHTVIAD